MFATIGKALSCLKLPDGSCRTLLDKAKEICYNNSVERKENK